MIYRLFLGLVLLSLLSSCSGREKYTYRPDPLSPRRGQKPYSINGERYEPLSSHQGFIETGIASWYGSDFHGKETSSGEVYDMHGMTAAHKTLPLGVYVKVQNRDNGREVVVRVNDRGPFVKGRIIDLSYSAAKDLGVVSGGTAPVRVEALGYLEGMERGKAMYRTPVSYDRGPYGIQVGAFGKMDNARQLADRVKQRYGFSSIREGNVGGTRYYRVRAGKFGSLKEAEKARESAEDRIVARGFVVALD